MSHPYPSEPASTTTLTPEAAGEYREMIAAAEQRITKLVPIAADFRVKLDSCEDVIADLRKQVQRWRGKLGEDVISLLPTDTDPGVPRVVAPLVPLPPRPLPVRVEYAQNVTDLHTCGGCGALTIARTDLGVWSHHGRELRQDGYLCWPERPDSTVAIPVFETPADPSPQGGDVRLIPSPTRELPYDPTLDPGQEKAMRRLESTIDPAPDREFEDTGS